MDVLPFRQDCAALCMGLDEAIMNARIRGDVGDTIRFYQFDPSTVSIGCFQSLNSQVDVERCEALGVDVVRRMTGGGSVFHDRCGEITYSVTIGIDKELGDIIDSYRAICLGLVISLEVLGIKASFSPVNDVLVGDRKISGSAQTRRKGVIMQHGTLMYDTDIDLLASVLKVSDEKLRDKYVQSVKKRVTSVSRELGHSDRDQTLNAMKEGFSRVFGQFREADIGAGLMLEAKEYASNKYGDKGYLFLR